MRAKKIIETLYKEANALKKLNYDTYLKTINPKKAKKIHNQKEKEEPTNLTNMMEKNIYCLETYFC